MPSFTLSQSEVEALARHVINTDSNDAVTNIVFKNLCEVIQLTQLALHVKVAVEIAKEIEKMHDINDEELGAMLAGGLDNGIQQVDVSPVAGAEMITAVFPVGSLRQIEVIRQVLK